jgi:lysophospholipase L1-like esterase
MRSSPVLLLCCIASFADAVLGQSLSINRKGENEVWIEASTPPDTRYSLQASGNLHLWADLHDEVQGQLSHRLDNAGVSQCFFRLTPWRPLAPPIRLVLLGDSTASDCCGWGQGLYNYFKPSVRFVNYAMPWFSTKLFLQSAEMDKLLVVRPDFVLVQFGFVDTAFWDSDRGTTLEEYRANLQIIIQTILGFEGIPILITPHAARRFDDQGKVIPWLVDRCAVVKAVAAELQTHLIDLNQLTTDLYNQLGDSESKYMDWNNDQVHFSPEGAQVISRLVVHALPDSLGPYLVGIFDPPSKP